MTTHLVHKSTYVEPMQLGPHLNPGPSNRPQKMISVIRDVHDHHWYKGEDILSALEIQDPAYALEEIAMGSVEDPQTFQQLKDAGLLRMEHDIEPDALYYPEYSFHLFILREAVHRAMRDKVPLIRFPEHKVIKLRRYENRVKKSPITICCDCEAIMKISKYPKHHCEFTRHGTRNVCPWACQGKISWRQGRKQHHVDHLVECFKRFVKDHKLLKRTITKAASSSASTTFSSTSVISSIPNINTSDTHVSLTSTLVASSATSSITSSSASSASSSGSSSSASTEACQPCTQWYETNQRTHLRFNLLGRFHLSDHPNFYQEVFAFQPQLHGWLKVEPDPKDLSSRALIARNELTFDESSGLRDAVEWIRKYVYFEEEYYWTHIAVRACAFQSFLHVFQPFAQDFCLLPYWCLCDGETTRHDDILYTTHRHMIAVCRSEDHFQSLWLSVRSDDYYRGKSYDRFRVQVKIRNVHHLAHVIRYVSGTKSQCNGVTIDRYEEGLPLVGFTHPSGQHHYFIAQPIPLHSVAVLHTILNSVLLLEYVKILSQSITLGLEGAEKLYDTISGRDVWHTLMSNLSKYHRNCALPLPKGFYVSDEKIAVKDLTVDNVPKCWITDMDDSLIVVKEGQEYQHFQERNQILNIYDHHLVRVSKIQQQILNAVEAGTQSLREDMRNLLEDNQMLREEIMKLLDVLAKLSAKR